MPIDPSIALQTKTPQLEQPDFASTLANGLKIKAAQLDILKNQNSFVANTLASAKDQATYDMAKQKIAASGDPKLAEIAARAPEVFDASFVNNALMSTLDTKDRLELLSKQHEQDFQQQKFGEEQRHNKATEANGANLFGNGLQGKAYNVLLNGDPNSPEYALAYSAASQPKLQPVVGPDGSTQLVAVTPELPGQIRRPNAPNPQSIVGQGGLMPPAMKGMPDATPTTPADQLLPPPGMPAPNSPVRDYTVNPIQGTKGAPKLTDDQTKAAGFTDRTIASHDIINQLTGEGYIPSLITDELGNSKIGNRGLTDQGQRFVQAKRDFVNAILRRESGAAISQSEFDNANKQYFPQPGDTPGNIAQKKQNRELAIESLKRSAGPAYKGANAPAATTNPLPAHLDTSQAAEIKSLFQAGKITREKAKAALQALGSQ